MREAEGRECKGMIWMRGRGGMRGEDSRGESIVR